MDPSSRRRGVKRRADGTPATFRPASDHSSSTSSDILVASAPTPSPPTRAQQKMGISARNVKGKLIVKGVGSLLRDLSERDFRRDNNQSADRYFRASGRGLNGLGDSAGSSHSLDQFPLLVGDDDGPNHKGTYSKAYTLRHPEYTWIHRGQGRYLPSSSTPKQTPRSQPSSFPQKRVSQPTRPAGRSSLRRQSGDKEDDEDDEEPLRSRPQATPNTKRSSYSFRGRPSELEAPSSSDLRAARLQRRSNAYTGDYEDDEDEEAMDDGDSEVESNRTYSKEYVEEHPEMSWRHCGNGFYKRNQPAATEAPLTQSTRRSSNRSFVKAESERNGMDLSRRYHSSELEDFSNVEFRHCGNGWFRPEAAFDSALSDTPDESEDEEMEDEFGARDGKYTKAQMIAYKNRYPDAEFTHRGNGRYVLADTWDSFLPAPVAPTPPAVEDPKKTFDKAYTEAHPNEKFHHAGSGRYRRGSRPSAFTATPNKPETLPKDRSVEVESWAEGSVELFSKAYVSAHPELEFHHRGVGKYALGPRPGGTPVAATPIPVLEQTRTSSPSASCEELVTTAYVEAHCDRETFYHRGQGRWARGLPPPGSSNKTAVRGPDASLAKLSRTPSNSMASAVPEEKVPGLDELLVKAEGPDKFPHLSWVYRGGGKWAQRPKQKEPVVTNNARSRTARGKGKARRLNEDEYGGEDDGVEAQIERETLAAEAADFYGTLLESRRPSLNDSEIAGAGQRRRKRTSLWPPETDSASRWTSKNPSLRSKTSTPRPQRMTLEEDRLSDNENYPELYANEWPEPRPDESNDEAAKLIRKKYRPLNSADAFVNALIRHDPATRPKEVLTTATAHVQALLQSIQDEYIALDKITAPHARIARRPARGGRLPVDPEVFEDRKEADLYDYNFDSRKIGYQDPETQRIVRDAEGRELRKRRNRSGLDIDPANAATTGSPAVEDLAPRRAVKPVSRFDAAVAAPTRRKRTAAGTVKGANGTQEGLVLPGGYQVPTSGRWAGHIPKRIRELRGDSLASAQTNGTGAGAGAGSPEATPGVEIASSPAVEGAPVAAGTGVRKGRPKGSKNLHKRRDAGIPKGPRKAKVVASIESLLAPPQAGEEGDVVGGESEAAGGEDATEIDQRGVGGEVKPASNGWSGFKAPGNGVNILQE